MLTFLFPQKATTVFFFLNPPGPADAFASINQGQGFAAKAPFEQLAEKQLRLPRADEMILCCTVAVPALP